MLIKAGDTKNGKAGIRGRNSGIVTDVLRGKIIRLELRPGDVLDEVSLARELGVSRTPMREALIRLAGENLVELTPNRGARVASINLPDIRELFEVLEVVQGVTTHWAALRRDEAEIVDITNAAVRYHENVSSNQLLAAVQSNFDFHVGIARAAKNKLFEAYYANLLSRTFRLGVLTFNPRSQHVLEEDVRLIESDHTELVRAITVKDGVHAEQIARKHAREFLLRVARYTSENLAAEIGSYAPEAHFGHEK